MSNQPDTISFADAVASQWIARRDRGMTPAEQAELIAWLTNPRHAEAFARCEAMWSALPTLRRLPAARLEALGSARLAPPAPVVIPAGAGKGRRRVFPLLLLGAAAAVALLLALPQSVEFSRAERVVHHYSAPSDSEARIALPDGSVVLLRRGSRIGFGEFPTRRLVALFAGEAHFTVAKTSPRPFLVRAGELTVRDIGTAFNVRLDSGRVAVLVTEGKVEVSRGADPAPAKGRLLTIGQEAIFEKHAAEPVMEVRVPQVAEVTQLLAWKSRRLTFDRTPLAEAVAELNRYNLRQIELGDADLGSLLISGGVQSDRLDALLQLLKTGFGVNAEERGDVVTLRRGH